VASMADPRVSVIVPTYRRPELLEACLAALRAQDLSHTEFEIAVVDDASGDRTTDVLRAQAREMPNLVWASQSVNAGPAATRNLAVSISHAPLLLFLDDDIIASPNLLSTHLALHAPRGPMFGVVGHVTWHASVTVTPFMEWLESEAIQFNYANMTPGPQREVWSAFYTCNLSVSREAFDAEGGFNENFPYPACEDSDLGARLAKRGFELSYHPEAIAWHSRGISLEECRERMYKTAPSKAYFAQLHPDAAPQVEVRPNTPITRVLRLGKREALHALSSATPHLLGVDVRAAYYRTVLGQAHLAGLNLPTPRSA
jgi:GT2 family glycosyltransferase